MTIMRTTLLLLGALSAGAVDCGKWYSNPCLAEADERLKRDGSDNIVDQAPVWGRLQGFWSYEVNAYFPDGEPHEPTLNNPDRPYLVGGFPYPYFPAVGFLNVTIDGPRMYQHRYIVHTPAPQEFCDPNVSFTSLVNVLGDGTCGVNGYSHASELFGTSSNDRDGSIVTLPIIGDSSEMYTSRPIDNRTIYSVTGDGSGGLLTETLVFLDSINTQISSVSEYSVSSGNKAQLAAFFRTDYRRLPDTNAFEEAIEEAYNAAVVRDEDRLGQPPMTTECLAETCPTETEWCTIDPTCSSSPTSIYQEPEGSVRSGLVAGVTVAGAALLIVALYFVHLYRLKLQEKRYRAEFAKRVAEHIEITESSYALGSSTLLEEFRRIDPGLKHGGAGQISKEAMKEFLQSGKVGYITESDFGALWVAIDIDHSGYVDFLEYCAFLGQCHDLLEKNDTSRESLAKSIAKRLAKLSMHDVSVRSKSLAAGMIVDERADEESREESKNNSLLSETSLRSAKSLGVGLFS